MAHGAPRRRKKSLDPWKIGAYLLSAAFMTIGIFLIFMALAEVLIYIIDVSRFGNRGYLDWWSTPLLMILVSIPFFLGYFILNLNRYAFYRKLKERLRIRAPPDHGHSIDDMEL